MSIDVFDYLIEGLDVPSEMAHVLIGDTDEDTIKNCIAVNKLINNDRAARAREQGQAKTEPKKKSGSSSGKSRLDALIEKYSK